MDKLNEPGNRRKTSRQNASEHSGVERRVSPRVLAFDLPTLKSISLNGGPEVDLLNISRIGALIESEVRMPPGIRIALRLVTANTVVHVSGRVTRSTVSGLKGKLRYKSALAFDKPLNIPNLLPSEEACLGPVPVSDGPVVQSPARTALIANSDARSG